MIAKAPSKKLAKAPSVSTQAGKAVSLKLSGLPKKTTLGVKVKQGNTTTALGKVRTTKAGRATVPTFTVDKPGAYTIQLTTAGGTKYFVKVIVS